MFLDLLTWDDFKRIGLGIADARILIEKFKDNTSEELKSMVEEVKNGKVKKPLKNSSKSECNVDLTWHNYNFLDKHFKLVKLSNGGGVRRKKFPKDIKLKEVKEEAQKIFFPNGRSRNGHLNLMTINLRTPSLQEITDIENKTLDDYITEHALKVCKIVLTSKEFRFKDKRV